MGEDGWAVAIYMLVEPDAGAGFGHDRCQRGLANLKRITPQIVAIEFDEVEGIEEECSLNRMPGPALAKIILNKIVYRSVNDGAA